MIEGAPRAATVRASEQLEVARLDGAVLRGLVALHPELSDLLERSAARDASSSSSRCTRLSRSSRAPRSAGCSRQLEPITAADGDVVVRAGEEADALLRRRGRPAARGARDARGRGLLRRLRTGDVLGERALLLGEPRVGDGRSPRARSRCCRIPGGDDRAAARRSIRRFARRDTRAARRIRATRSARSRAQVLGAPQAAPVEPADPTGGVEV